MTPETMSRFLIVCKKFRLFLREIVEIKHVDSCCGFNFKTFSKLQAVITIMKLKMPTCSDLLTEKPKLANQNTEAANGCTDF